MSYQAVSHLAFVLYICVIWKQWVPVREISSHIQNQLGIRAGNDRRPSTAVSSRHFLQWDLGWVCLEERDSPLQVAWPEDLPRAATSQCQFWHVTATRRPPIAGITPDQHQSVRRSCLSVFQPSFFSFDTWNVSVLCFLFFFSIRVSYFDLKWLLPALCSPFLEPQPSQLQN